MGKGNFSKHSDVNEGFERAVKIADKLGANATKKIKRLLRDEARIIESNMKRDAPVDEGFLRSQINGEPSLNGLKYKIESAAEYSLAIEFGRAKGTHPPIGPILEWVQRKKKGGAFSEFETPEEIRGLAYAIRNKIYKEGTDPKPFLIDNFEKGSREYFLRMKELLKEILADVKKY